MTYDRRNALNIPQGRSLPSHQDAVRDLVNSGLHDVLEQIHHGLTDEDRLQQVDRLATIAMTIEPNLMSLEIEPIKAKFRELYDTLVVPEPLEPTSWRIEQMYGGNEHLWTQVETHPTYALAHRALRDRLRDYQELSPERHRVIPIYPTITGA